jgi:hypothetical protein
VAIVSDRLGSTEKNSHRANVVGSAIIPDWTFSVSHDHVLPLEGNCHG